MVAPKRTMMQMLFPNTIKGGGYAINPLVDIATLPTRAIAALPYSGQKIDDPSAYALKPLVEKIPTKNKMIKGNIEVLGQMASDPLSLIPASKIPKLGTPLKAGAQKLSDLLANVAKKAEPILNKVPGIIKSPTKAIDKLVLDKTLDVPDKVKSLSASGTNYNEGKKKLIDLLVENNLILPIS